MRLAETKAINVSLMALKDCVRARTAASQPGAGHGAHVPYRRSKLTLLMKDVFDVSGQQRPSATVVLAMVSPLARDAAQSANTLAYAAPLRVATAASVAGAGRASGGGVNWERDARDPALWSNAQLVALLQGTATKAGEPSLDAAALAGGGRDAGSAFCALAEAEVHRRVRVVLAPHGRTPAAAAALGQALYQALWTALVDAKVRARKPDGSLVTAEEEEAERAAGEQAQKEKDELWKEREKHLATER